jgi:anti-anti-sigma regulatory factor
MDVDYQGHEAPPAVLLPTELSLEQQLVDHPLATGVSLRTLPIEDAILAAKRAAACGSAGFTLLAPPGAGRKSAARVIVQELSRCYSQMPVVMYTQPRLSRQYLLERWQGLLLALGNTLLIGRAPALRDRCVRTLEDAVRKKGGQGTILFVIQNAEWLDEAMVAVLLDLRDAMRDIGQRLYFLNVAGSARAEKVSSKFASSDVAGEFMGIIGTPHLFRHISTEDDFRHLLRQIDERRLPSNLRCTWSQFYLPRAYSKDFRLENYAKVLDSARTSFAAENPNVVITTRKIFEIIRIVLIYSTVKDSEELKLDEATWGEAFWEAHVTMPGTLVLANEE